MPDITVSRPAGERESGAIPRRGLPLWAARHVGDDDEILARLLITSWTLATGRTLRSDVAPQFLSDEELISFWADERITVDQMAPADDVPPAGPR